MDHFAFKWPRWQERTESTAEDLPLYHRLKSSNGICLLVEWTEQPGGSFILPPWSKPHDYEPIRYPELPSKFADIRSENDALKFADEWGLLGLFRFFPRRFENDWNWDDWISTRTGGRELDPIRERLSERLLGSLYAGESVRLWREEAALMRGALQAWDHIKDGDYDAAVRVLPLLRNDRYPTAPHNADRRRAALRQAKLRLLDFINVRLIGGTQSFLSLDSRGCPETHTIPTDLRSCLWLQVSQIVAGNIRPCEGCGEWMKVTRKDMRFCNENCGSKYRMRQHREKVRQKSAEQRGERK